LFKYIYSELLFPAVILVISRGDSGACFLGGGTSEYGWRQPPGSTVFYQPFLPQNRVRFPKNSQRNHYIHQILKITYLCHLNIQRKAGNNFAFHQTALIP
jgi:hypothetical protein